MHVSRRALYEALKELNRVAPTKSATPILSCVLMQYGAGRLMLTATGITTRLNCELPAYGEEFTAALPVKLLTKIVKPEGRGDAGHVIFEPVGESVKVTIDGLVTCLPATDPTLFPAAFTKDQQWSLVGSCDAKRLQEALTWVLPAASSDPTRKHLQSVYVDEDGVAVCSDGHRLHLAHVPISPDMPMLLSSDSASVLARALKHSGQAIVARHTSNEHDLLRVRCGSFELTTRLMDEQFPPWKQVVPDRDAQTTQIIFDTAVLKKALSQVMRLTEHGSLRVSVNGSVALSPWGACLGDAEVIVPTVENQHLGDDLELGLDGRYLVDGLPPGKGTVEIRFGKQLDPVRLDLSEQRVAVIMPLRL